MARQGPCGGQGAALAGSGRLGLGGVIGRLQAQYRRSDAGALCCDIYLGIFHDEGRGLNSAIFVQEFNPGCPSPLPRPLWHLQLALWHANIARAPPLIQLTRDLLGRRESGPQRTGAGFDPARRRTPEIEARKISETGRFSLAPAWCRQLHPGKFWGLQARIFRASERY